MHAGGGGFESCLVHMKFHVYIIYNAEFDKFYIGQTNNLDQRILKHNLGLSPYTSKYKSGWEKAYCEEFGSRTEAIKRENFLKKQKNKNFYKKLCEML